MSGFGELERGYDGGESLYVEERVAASGDGEAAGREWGRTFAGGQHLFKPPFEVGRQSLRGWWRGPDALVEVGDGGGGVPSEPAQEMADLGCGHGAAEGGLAFQVHERGEEDTGSRVVEVEQEVGTEGKAAEQGCAGGPRRRGGFRSGVGGGVFSPGPSGMGGGEEGIGRNRPSGDPEDAGWRCCRRGRRFQYPQ